MSTSVLLHNREWAARYRAESEKIQSAISVKLYLHHIGSTAVPHLSAKDCIDILGVVENFEDGKELIEPLESLKYEYRGEYGIKGRHYFAKDERGKVHLHVFEQGSKEIQKHLHFVHVMSANPDLVEEFNRIKRELVKRFPDDRSRYQQEKAFFYEKVAAIETRP